MIVEEQALWCAVLLQAIEDAKGAATDVGNAINRRRVTDSARDWLTKPNRDFNIVCNLAGLDPVAVRERAHAAITKPARHRKPAPGVASNFRDDLGTGGGSTARDFSQLEIFE